MKILALNNLQFSQSSVFYFYFFWFFFLLCSKTYASIGKLLPGYMNIFIFLLYFILLFFEPASCLSGHQSNILKIIASVVPHRMYFSVSLPIIYSGQLPESYKTLFLQQFVILGIQSWQQIQRSNEKKVKSPNIEEFIQFQVQVNSKELLGDQTQQLCLDIQVVDEINLSFQVEFNF